MKKTEERDHVDRWLESAWLEEIPNLDFAVEGIVDRMSGLSRRFKRTLNETLAEHGLSYEEWDVLGALRRAGPPFRRSAGELAEISELSSGAMTNRLDRLEKAGLVKRLSDPNDRRGVERPREGTAERAATPAHARVRAPRRQAFEEALAGTVPPWGQSLRGDSPSVGTVPPWGQSGPCRVR